MNNVSSLESLDADRVAKPESIGLALKRRFAGRYPVDPFGLDPQLANIVSPLVGAVLPVNVTGGEHVPESGPAAIVANRGFGIVEPSALALAVHRATGRRLRVVGAVPMPFVGALVRRLGSIAATEDDVRSAIRAGHLVGVPLSPTWLRTGAGMPPHALMPALTHAPIIPAAVVPGGPFGTAIGAWRVRFGPLVQLDQPYDPDDPLAAARFADAVRARVRALLAE